MRIVNRPQPRMMADMQNNRRTAHRIAFSHRIDARIVAIDGTWRRSCSIEDIAQSGAKLTIAQTIEGLNLKEFFLVLSSTGLAYRRCELSWVNGNQLGVRFIQVMPKQKGKARPRRAASQDSSFHEI